MKKIKITVLAFAESLNTVGQIFYSDGWLKAENAATVYKIEALDEAAG